MLIVPSKVAQLEIKKLFVFYEIKLTSSLEFKKFKRILKTSSY